jgi:outer membrane protein assembly factor BamB
VASDLPTDPHAVLGVAPGATYEQVRRAYRRAARANHPDVGGDPAVFVAVRMAFEALMAPPVAGSEHRSPPPQSGTARADRPPRGPRRSDAPTVMALRAAWPGARSLWRVPAGPAAVADSGVVVSAVGDDPGVMRASATTGTMHWRAPLAAPATAVAFDAGAPVVVVADSSSVLHGLDTATGVTRWQKPTATLTDLAVMGGGATLVGGGNHLWVVAADGTTAWTVRLAEPVTWLAVAGATLLAATADTVVGVNAQSGTTRWWGRWTTQGRPAVVVGATVWMVDGPSTVVGLDPATGAARHRVELPSGVVGLDAVGDQLAVRTSDDALVVLGRGGSPRYRVLVPGGCSAPTVVAGAVTVAAGDGTIRFLSPATGAELHWVATSADGHHGTDVRSRRLVAAADTVVLLTGGDADTVALGTTG